MKLSVKFSYHGRAVDKIAGTIEIRPYFFGKSESPNGEPSERPALVIDNARFDGTAYDAEHVSELTVSIFNPLPAGVVDQGRD